MYSLICYKPPSKRSYEALEYLFDNTEDESSDENDADTVRRLIESSDSEDIGSTIKSQASEKVIENLDYPDDDSFFLILLTSKRAT